MAQALGLGKMGVNEGGGGVDESYSQEVGHDEHRA